MKRLDSREERLRKAGVTFGPMETEETLMHQYLKKKSDNDSFKKVIQDQINSQMNSNQQQYQREIEMEKHNVNSAIKTVSAQNRSKQQEK